MAKTTPYVKFTAQQKAFCEEYIKDFNGKRAAEVVGYKPTACPQTSSQLLKQPHIQNYIRELKEKRNNILGISKADMLDKLIDYANSDITDTINLGTEDIKALPVSIRQMISSYKLTRQKIGDILIETIELKFIDKVRIIDMINRHIGFYEEEDNQQKVTIIVNRPQRSVE